MVKTPHFHCSRCGIRKLRSPVLHSIAKKNNFGIVNIINFLMKIMAD